MVFDFAQDPFENLDRQLKAVRENASVVEPTAMSLATANKDGSPTVRAVLFKGMVRGGLSFYTNYESPKSLQLSQNPNAALLFFWAPVAQQIRITGKVEKLTRAESEAYFASRPRLSQLGAWASVQSQEITSLAALEDRVAKIESQFAGKEVPCPPHWGGFHLLPLEFEFWFGRDGRLHERYIYQRRELSSREWKSFMRSP